jgi:hypothetical protein
MAFCKPLDSTTTPILEWQRLGYPNNTIFRYFDGVVGGYTVYYTFVPCDLSISSLNIVFITDKYRIEIAMEIYSSSKTKHLFITDSDMEIMISNFYNPILPTDTNIFECIKDIYTIYNIDLFQTLATLMYGNGYKVIGSLEHHNIKKRANFVVQNQLSSLSKSTTLVPGTMMGFYYQKSLEAAASSKIKAAYKGWKARMKYRYNPFTTLGKHLITKMMMEKETP